MFRYTVPAPHNQDARDEVFFRMLAEGLLGVAMSAIHNPTLEDWRRVSDPARGWLLCCESADSGELMGAGLFTPWRGQTWEFDFTAFRATAHLAVDMARGGFAWMFANAPCEAIVGLCPLPSRHAWRLAARCGFVQFGRIPGACWHERLQRHVPGVFVVVTPETLSQ